MSKDENANAVAWVTLASYNWVAEAQVLRTLLENEGIETLIPEEFAAGVAPHLTAMTVRVQVRAHDLARAQTLRADVGAIDEDELAEAAANAGPAPFFANACTHCHSTQPAIRRRSRLNWIRGLLGLFVGVPMRAGHVWICPKCETNR